MYTFVFGRTDVEHVTSTNGILQDLPMGFVGVMHIRLDCINDPYTFHIVNELQVCITQSKHSLALLLRRRASRIQH